MNYTNHYNRLIEKAINRPVPEGYTERHHIVPKALGGSNDRANLVELTAREHFVAHLLLAKIHGGSMWAPVYLMRGSEKLTANKYAWVRKRFAEAITGEGNPFYGRTHTAEAISKMTRFGTKHSEQTRRHYSETRRGPNNPMFGKKHSEDTKKKIAESKVGIIRDPSLGLEHSKKMTGSGNPRFGVKLSEETKEKIRAKALERNRK